MNGTFFKNPNFSENNENYNTNYNILNYNFSKKVKVFTIINVEKYISGILEDYQNSFLIISDPNNGNWLLIPDKYIYYIEFEEKISF